MFSTRGDPFTVEYPWRILHFAVGHAALLASCRGWKEKDVEGERERSVLCLRLCYVTAAENGGEGEEESHTSLFE